MRKFGIITAKAGIAALAASMVFQTAAMAAPADELNAIMEAQSEMTSESLIGEFIGFSDLGKAMKESGLQIQLDAGLLAETIELMDLDEQVTEDGHFSFNLQIDPELKKWLAEGSVGPTEESFLDFSLYGDSDRLALSMPQFFSGALSLHGGSLREQYETSALAEILGEMPEDIPDIDLTFYPTAEMMKLISDLSGGNQEELQQILMEASEDLQVEKTEEGDSTIYTATFAMSDIMEIYRSILDSYSTFFMDTGLITVEDNNGMQMDLDEMLSQLETVYGESVDINFEVKDDLVQGFNYEIYMDTSTLADEETEYAAVVEDTLEPAGTAEDAVAADVSAGEETEAAAETEIAAETETAATAEGTQTETMTESESVPEEDFQGYLNYQVSYVDPEDLSKGMDFEMTISDADRNSLGSAAFGLYRETTDDVTETYSMFMEIIDENGEVQYTGTPFSMTFNSATGDLDALFAVDDGSSRVEMNLDSTFSQVEKGKKFVWTIDELSISADDEKMGLTAEILAAAQPGEIAAPEEERDVLAMTQAELLGLVTEISVNAETWSAQFAPEESTESEFAVQDSEAYQSEAETEQSETADTEAVSE